MTDVKRYWIDDDRKIEDTGEVQHDLLARLSRDEARAFVRVVLSEDYDAIRAEVERLTQERDDAVKRSSSYLVDLNACRKERDEYKVMATDLIRARGHLKACLQAHIDLAAKICYAEPELSQYRALTRQAQQALGEEPLDPPKDERIVL